MLHLNAIALTPSACITGGVSWCYENHCFLMWVLFQPPSQALLFSHGRGERETRVTGDEPQGTMKRVQTAGEAPARSCVVFFARKQPPHTQDADKQFYSPTWQRELV